MSNTNLLTTVFRVTTVVSAVLFAMVFYSGCISTGPPPPAPTTGLLSVEIAFGIGGSHFCRGGIIVAIDRTGFPRMERGIEFQGISSSTSPDCKGTAVFEKLTPGPWTISLRSEGNPERQICTKNVVVGLFNTVNIRTDAPVLTCN